MRRLTLLLLFFLNVLGALHAQGVRSHTKPAKGTVVSESQASDLTLTIGQAAVRPIQQWVRTAGAIDKSGKVLTAYLYPPDDQLVKVGQRVRAFAPESKSSMFQAWVTRTIPENGRMRVEVTFAATGWKSSRNYVVEIVTERGWFLSIPNEAIIEEGDKHIVYLQPLPGHYIPKEIQIGVQGELYTQVIEGLNDGDQVVTVGSFFIDAEHKLKATDQGTTGQ
jgi:hypothetical protein